MCVPCTEVVAAAEVDVAERLEVRDRARPHPCALRRGEAEEELGRLRDQVGARDLRGLRHLLRQRTAAVEAAAREAAADRREVEQLRVAQTLSRVVDVRAHVGADEDRDVVRLELGVERVAREALGVEEHRLAGAAVVRQQTAQRVGCEPPEVRQPPGHRDAEPRRRRRVVAVEPGEHVGSRRPARRAGRRGRPRPARSRSRGAAAVRAPRCRCSARRGRRRADAARADGGRPPCAAACCRSAGRRARRGRRRRQRRQRRRRAPASGSASSGCRGDAHERCELLLQVAHARAA